MSFNPDYLIAPGCFTHNWDAEFPILDFVWHRIENDEYGTAYNTPNGTQYCIGEEDTYQFGHFEITAVRVPGGMWAPPPGPVTIFIQGPCIVRFLRNDNSLFSASEVLNVSNDVTTVELPKTGVTNWSTISTDADNFRLEVNDALAGNSVDVTLQVNSGPEMPYTLDRKGNTNRGLFLRLVADTKDDAASENGPGPMNDPDNQTIFVKLEDVVRIKYSPAPAQCTAELQVGRSPGENDDSLDQLKHDIRELQLHIVVFQKNAGGGPSVTRAQVETDIADTNERLAQSTIRLVPTIDMGGAGDPGVPLPGGLANGFDPSPNQIVTMLSADESAVLPFKDANPAGANTIDVFYVEILNGGVAFGTRGMSYPASANATGDARNTNWIVIGSGSAGGGDPHNLAHEIMHILLDRGHRNNEPSTAVFKSVTTMGKDVNGTKRIGPDLGSANAGVGFNDTSTIRGKAENLP
jgi:hypothetical protein